MKKRNKNLRFAFLTAMSAIAVMCLLFAACPNGDEPDPDDPKKPNGPDSEAPDNSEFLAKLEPAGLTITSTWFNNYGTIGYIFYDGSWGNGQNQVADTLALPPGSYYRVVFDNLYGDWEHGHWPTSIHDGWGPRDLKTEFLTIGFRGHDQPSVFLHLDGLGTIEDGDDFTGIGEAFIPVDQLKKFMYTHLHRLSGYVNYFELGYMKYSLLPGERGNPFLVEYPEGTITLEAWRPKEPVAANLGLLAAITSAENYLASVTRTTNGTSLSAGTRWAFEDDWDVFEAAIDTAKTFSGTGEPAIFAAEIALDTARAAFVNVVMTVGTTNKYILNNDINAAQILLEMVVRSADGNDAQGEPLPPGTRWATEADCTTFNNAINAALDIYENADATQAAVNTGVVTLSNARTNFENVITIVSGDTGFKATLRREASHDRMFNWSSYWGSGFAFHNYENADAYLLGLPPDGYFMVEFEGIDEYWPQTVTLHGGTYTFRQNYLTFFWRDGNNVVPRVNVPLTLGAINNGIGEAFMPISVFQDYLTENPREDAPASSERLLLFYGPLRILGTDTYPQGLAPTIIVNESNNALFQVWVPDN